jgi:hypothetical protein
MLARNALPDLKALDFGESIVLDLDVSGQELPDGEDGEPTHFDTCTLVDLEDVDENGMPKLLLPVTLTKFSMCENGQADETVLCSFDVANEGESLNEFVTGVTASEECALPSCCVFDDDATLTCGSTEAGPCANIKADILAASLGATVAELTASGNIEDVTSLIVHADLSKDNNTDAELLTFAGMIANGILPEVESIDMSNCQLVLMASLPFPNTVTSVNLSGNNFPNFTSATVLSEVPENLSVDLSNQANIDFCDIKSPLIFRNYAALNICDADQTGLSWNVAFDASGVAYVNALITAVDDSAECQADGLQM